MIVEQLHEAPPPPVPVDVQPPVVIDSSIFSRVNIDTFRERTFGKSHEVNNEEILGGYSLNLLFLGSPQNTPTSRRGTIRKDPC